MFSIATLKTELVGAIGLRNTDDPTLPDCTLTSTDTGQYYNDFHPSITYENLYYIAPNYDGNSYTDFAAATNYATGDFAKSVNIAYKATRTIAATSTLPASLTAWSSPVNAWITDKINASISTLGNKIQTNKKIQKSTKTLLSNVQLIDGAGRLDDTITASSRFVGFEITPKFTNNITPVLDFIGLQFSTAQTALPVYLYHSSQNLPIGTFSFTTTAGRSFDWLNAADNISTGSYTMPYVDYTRNIDAGGTYYLGYYEDDITGSAIEKDFSKANIKMFSKFMDIMPISVSGTSGTNLFDIDDVGYTESSFGMNLSISVKTDITALLVSNKTILTNALGYQFANDMLNEMLHNPSSRINRNQENATRNKILYELTGDENTDSLQKKVDNAISAMEFDFSEISQVLPKRKPGMKSTWR